MPASSSEEPSAPVCKSASRHCDRSERLNWSMPREPSPSDPTVFARRSCQACAGSSAPFDLAQAANARSGRDRRFHRLLMLRRLAYDPHVALSAGAQHTDDDVLGERPG